MQSVFVIITKVIASKNYFCKEVFCNNFGRDGNVIVVFQALGKQPVIHRPELHRRQMNSQTIIDVNNYIAQKCPDIHKIVCPLL